MVGLIVFVLAWLFPPTSDDWRRLAFPDRTLAGYVEQAFTSYQGHNGRIVGNSISFLLIDPTWLRALVKAVTVVGLVAAIQRLVTAPGRRGLGDAPIGSGYSPWLALLVFAGVFLVPAGVFRESYVWSAGFFNYVPPLIAIVWLVGTIAERWPARLDAVGAGVTCGVVAFIAALFVEHVNVALLGLAIGASVWALARRERPTPALVGWVVGGVLGSVVMFASPGLTDVVNHEDAYFSYPSTLAGALDKAVVNYATITRAFLLSNPVLLVWLILLIVAASVMVGGRRRLGLAAAGVLGVHALATRLVAPHLLTCSGLTGDTCHRRVLALDVAVLALALGLVVWLGVRLVREADRPVFAGLLAATLLMMGPLLVVSPIGPRNLVGSTITLTALLALCSRDLLARRAGLGLGLKALAVLAAGVGLPVLAVVQADNARVAAQRVTLMEQAVAGGEHRVALPPFPHPEWVHDPRDPKIGNRYFIETPRDIEIDHEE